MPTYKLTIAYDGTNYCGWQTQDSRRLSAVSHQKETKPRLKTIQQEIESSLQKIFNKKIKIEGSGRTDTGVHALAQTAHFKTDKPFELLKLQNALNANLPRDILCVRAEEEKPDFHARFCANRKVYRYVIINIPQRPLFSGNFAAWIRFPLKVNEMRGASRHLLGSHDFRSFQATDSVVRRSQTTIYRIDIKKIRTSLSLPFLREGVWVTIDIEASGFLRNMVRNIVGTLIEVGRGKLAKDEMRAILRKKDRRFAGPCAVACGLYLMDVKYGSSK
jgi:tRNA pseudouridine38-40 synthase